MKEQDKNPEELISEVEIGNLPENEFRIMIVKMIQDIRKRTEAQTRRYKKYFFGHTAQLLGSLFPDQELNPGPQQ